MPDVAICACGIDILCGEKTDRHNSYKTTETVAGEKDQVSPSFFIPLDNSTLPKPIQKLFDRKDLHSTVTQ